MLLRWCIFVLLTKGILMRGPCNKSETCTECIRNPNYCIWCPAINYNETRCVPRSSYKDHWCPVPYEDELDINKPSPSNNSNAQIQPMNYGMKLRIGEQRKFSFTYKNNNNPIDLYFLMDASGIMKDKKDTLANKIQLIYNGVKKLTEDVTIGIGTFIDKNTFSTQNNTDKTYSFKHQLPLTTSYQEFKTTMNSMTFGINGDPPTGCLDALAQAIVCEEIIKWRTKSRKIIILITSNKYHEASDGRSSNIDKPYIYDDVQVCYSDNSTRKYTKELEVDYPSVGLINKLVEQHKVTVLFFVESSMNSIYQSLSNSIVGSYVDDWVSDSSQNDGAAGAKLNNIYEKIIQNVTLNVDINPENRKNVKVSLIPDCTQGKRNEKCLVQTGKSLEFEGTVQILDYNGMDKASIEISVHAVTAKLSLDVDIVSECNCKGNEISATFCNGRPLECGLCKCDQGISECIKESDCNGNPCICGSCQCIYPYSGKSCQCHETRCAETKNGHGECIDGECQCRAEWSGHDCSCPKSTDRCKGQYGNICNDHGKCVCGKCECPELFDWDSRHQDEGCYIFHGTDSHNEQCTKLRSYVLHYYNDDQKSSSGPNIIVTSSETVKDNPDTTWKPCPTLTLDGGCYTNFAYRYQDYNRIELLVQATRDCEVNIWKVCGILFTTLLVIGIGTLITWKVIMDRRDKKEYMALMKTYNLDSGAQSNALYVEPCVTFKNPSYRPDPDTKQ